jgi:hypothetical protein
VRVVLDECNLGVSISEVREWFNKHGIDPGAFQYHMAAEHVRLIIDFIIFKDAVEFADAFGGLVLNRTTPAEVDTIDAEGKPPEAEPYPSLRSPSIPWS